MSDRLCILPNRGLRIRIGAVNVIHHDSEVYDGPYEVTPTRETQTLPTVGKTMTADVTVAPIPPEFVDTSDADAIAAHLKKDDTAYVDGVKIIGEAELKYIAETEELILPDWMVTLE